jgi:hypothetical protein
MAGNGLASSINATSTTRAGGGGAGVTGSGGTGGGGAGGQWTRNRSWQVVVEEVEVQPVVEVVEQAVQV